MTFLAAAAPALLSAGGSMLGGLFGGSGSSPQVNFSPPGFNAGGLTASFGGNGYNISPSADRTAAVGNIANTFGQQASDLGALRSTVTPGFSALRTAQMNTLNSNRTAALGNLRDNLARRRVLGSSFAQDSLARADQEYQQTAANVQAQTYLQELQASQQLLQQQYTAARGQFQTGLDEMNLEASLAADLTGKASSALESAASTQAQLDAKAAAGAGSFFGGIGQQFGSALGGLFKSSGGGGGSSLGSIGQMASALGAIY